MLMQSAFVAALFLSGGAIAATIARPRSMLALATVALPIGTVVFVLFGLLFSVVGWYGPWSLLAAYAGLAALLARDLSGLRHRSALITLLSGTLVTGALSISFALNNYAMMSYDSFRLLLFGRLIGALDGFDSLNAALLASWGVFLPMLQSTSDFLGLDYLAPLQPVFVTTSLFGLGVFVFLNIRDNANVWLAAALASVLVVMVATSYFVVFQAFYLHNSALTAIFVGVLLAGLWTAATTPDRGSYLLVLVGLIGFTLQRTESAIFAVAFLVAAYSAFGHRHARFHHVVYLYAALVAAWSAYQFASIGAGSDILSPERLAILGATPTALALVIFTLQRFSDTAAIRWLIDNASLLMFTAGLFVVLGLSIVDHGQMLTNLTSIYTNATRTGRWAALWMGIAAALLLVQILPRMRQERFWLVCIGMFVIILLMMGYARIPFRIGWGDSANRITTHVLPIIVMYLGLKAGAAFSGERARRPFEAKWFAPTAIVFALLVIPVFAPGGSLDTWHNNVLRDAEVLEQPAWSPGFDLKTGLKGETRYASSAPTGAQDLVFALPSGVSAGLLELKMYSSERRWTDYTWEIDQGDGNWTTFFEPNSTTNLVEHIELSESHYCLRFALDADVARLRLRYRSELDPVNRLLFKHLAIWESSLMDDLSLLLPQYQRCVVL